MTKYRIVQHHKPGYYCHYTIQRRFLFFWIDEVGGYCFDDQSQAENWIARQPVVETVKVVKEVTRPCSPLGITRCTDIR